MATSEDVKKLAALARLTVTDAELEKFSKEFDGILAYVGQIETLSVSKDVSTEKPLVRNVFRTDGAPHESGIFTEALAEQFRGREGDALKVKQIITHD